jgi:tetratricopeptide (TPR) repeat protein
MRSYLRGQDAETVRRQVGPGAVDIAQMLPELHELFPDLPAPPTVDPESARFQLFDSTATFLRNAAKSEPLVLVIEDLHAADTASILLLRFLAGQLADISILILGTYRDVELTPDHPLTATLPELTRESVARLVHLRGLDEPDVAAFVEATTEVPPGAQLVSMLYRETKGNPLFLGEAMRLLAAEGRLRGPADSRSLRIAVPAGVREVILRRLDHLSEDCREVLVLASVLGPEFTVETVRRMGELSADGALDLLGEAVQSGLLVEAPGAPGRFRFSHDLVRETLYESLSPARRVRLHRRAGEVMEELHGTELEPHLAEMAHHFFEGAPGGDAERAADYARRAGDQAAASLAYEEAARLFRMALQARELAGTVEDEVRLDLLLALGEAHSRAGDLAVGRERFLEAAAIARRIGSVRELALAALGYGGRFPWARAGDDPHLIPLLQDALVLSGGSDEPLRVRLLTRLACALRDSPDRERSAALSQQAVDMARQLGDPSTLGYALGGRFWAIWGPDKPEERLELATELLQVAIEARDGERIADAHLAIGAALTDMGRMDLAKAEVELVSRVAEELRQPTHGWLGRATWAYLMLMEGNFAVAEELILEGLRAGDWTPVRDNISTARTQLFLLRREQRRGAEVEAVVRSSVTEFPWYPLHRAALACLLLDLGRRDEARAVFEDLSRDGFGALHRDNEWLLGIGLAAEACSMLGAAESAEVLYEQLLPFPGRNAVGHAEGSVGATDRYLGLLATTLSRLDEAERHFTDAVEMNERMGARPWAAHTRYDLARMLLARDGPGDRERANELLGRALATARELGMVALEEKLIHLGGEVPIHAPAPARAPAPAVFRREGEYWSIAFEGQAFRLHDSKGLRYLATLLAVPGREIHALDLVGGEEGSEPERAAIGDAGEVLDPQAKAAYRRRLEELREEIEEAESWNDPERVVRAKEEVEFLAHELAAATGLGGRDRKVASASERARVNVTRAIKAALARIAEHSPSLSRHLEATVRTGTFCSYSPDPRIPSTWQL